MTQKRKSNLAEMIEKHTVLFFEREGVATRSSTGGVFSGACCRFFLRFFL